MNTNATLPDILARLDDARKAGADLLADELMFLSEAYRGGVLGHDTAGADDTARELRRQAADKGHPLALVAEAVALMEEAGGHETPEALSLIERAAALGEAESRFNIAMGILSDAASTPGQIADAMQMLRNSAAAGFADALFQLALMHKLGKFVEADPVASAYYELAALDAGSRQAPDAIALLFTPDMISADGTVDRDAVMRRACEANLAPALFDAFCTSLEKGSDIGDKESFALLRRSADTGYIPAMITLSDFTDEAGVTLTARQLLEKGARECFPVAMSSLGRFLYAEGDKEQGRRLIEAALNFGNVDAMVFVAELTARGDLPDPTGGARSRLYTLMSRELMEEHLKEQQ